MKFQKEILRNQRGLETNAGDTLRFAKEDFQDIVDNFKSGKVWIPYTHTDASDPRNNTGFVKKIWYDEKANSLWALMDIDDDLAVERIKSKKIQDVSVSLRNDEERGWVLNHVALTLDPALKAQKPFKEMEEGDQQIELNNLEPFVNMSGDKGAIMKGKDKKPDVEEVVEDDVTEDDALNLEEAKNLITKVKDMFDFAGKNKGLGAELEKRDTKITELEGTVKEGQEAIEVLLEDKRKREWDLVFESYSGRRCVPAEKELLAERITDPDALKVELDARVDIGLTVKKADEAHSGSEDDLFSNLDDEQLEFVKGRGWDQKENEKYLKAYLAQLEEQND